MTSTKPYLIRALWQWCIDQGQTPQIHVIVDEHTQVPLPYVKDGQITLNIGLDATNQLDMGNEYISFQARFSGVAQQLFIPVERVAAIYARESNEGMGFEVTETAVTSKPAATTTDASVSPSQDKPVPVIAAVTAKLSDSTDESDPPPPSSGGPKPRFTVVK